VIGRPGVEEGPAVPLVFAARRTARETRIEGRLVAEVRLAAEVVKAAVPSAGAFSDGPAAHPTLGVTAPCNRSKKCARRTPRSRPPAICMLGRKSPAAITSRCELRTASLCSNHVTPALRWHNVAAPLERGDRDLFGTASTIFCRSPHSSRTTAFRVPCNSSTTSATAARSSRSSETRAGTARIWSSRPLVPGSASRIPPVVVFYSVASDESEVVVLPAVIVGGRDLETIFRRARRYRAGDHSPSRLCPLAHH
jgi:hypothetical protein